MGKLKILYIGDDDVKRRATATDLRSNGYSVSVATSGAIGLRLFHQRTFDAILCDLDKPENSSLAALEKIR